MIKPIIINGLLAASLSFPSVGLLLPQSILAQTQVVPAEKSELEQLEKRATQQLQQGQTEQALVTWQRALQIAQRRSLRQWQAKALYGIGRIYEQAGQLQQALEVYQQARLFYRDINDPIMEATTLTRIGLVHYNIGEPQKALESYNQGLRIIRTVNNKAGQSGEAMILSIIGLFYVSTGQPHKALEYYEQTLPVLRANSNKSGEASTLAAIGDVYSRIGQPQKALEYLNQALLIRKALPDKAGEISILTAIGTIYANTGQPREALEYFNQALQYYKDVRDKFGQARTLNEIGAIYTSSGQTQKALEAYKQALTLAVTQKRMEAAIINNIGALYYQTGQLQQALESYNQALAIKQAIDDKDGQATSLHNIGNIYAESGQPQKALEYLNQALLIQRAIDDKQGQASTLRSIGQVYVDDGAGQSQKALEYFYQALSICRAIKDQAGEALTLNDIGGIYSDINQPQKALEYYNQALSIQKATNRRVDLASTLNNVGVVYSRVKQPQKALEYYNQALPIHRAVNNQRGQATTLLNLADLERSRGNLQVALTQIEAAIKIIEGIRTELVSPELRTSYFASQQMYYRFYIDLLMQLHQQQPTRGFDALALNASERSRARGLLDLLNEARIDIRQGVDPKLLEQEKTLQLQLSALEKRQIQILSSNPTLQQTAALEQAYRVLQSQYQQNQEQIRRTSPRYAALTQPQPLTLAEIRQQLLDSNTLLLVYSLGKDRSYLWAVTKARLSSYVLPKEAEINQLARQVYGLFTNRRANFVKTELDTASTQLSQMLLGPVASQLGQKRLVIVADGALQYLPFAALPIPQGNSKTNTTVAAPLLLPQHDIINLPSASTLAILRRDTQGRKPAPKTVAIMADPVFSQNDPRLRTSGKALAQAKPTDLAQLSLQRSASQTRINISRLQNTRLEAEAIAQLLPTNEQQMYLDFAANLNNATSPQLAQYQIVHFATHGILNSQMPELSGLVLSLVNEQGEAENGFLRLREIFNLNLRADLVVLSACKTGLGRDIQGEGLVGLTRGFMYAGAPRLVVSLWNVDDRATALLMSKFYQGLLGRRLPPAVALRQAQQALRQQARYSAPYYWAAFTLQGEWQ